MKTNDAQKQLAAALGRIPSGLFIVTLARDGRETGLLASWVQQCSFKPPLVAMGVKKDSKLYGQLMATKQFSLSFLESGQKDIAFAFFKPVSVDGNIISGQAFETAETGAPIISAAPAWVEGRVVGEVQVGDHSCVVGEVTNSAVKREAKVLTLEEVGVKYGG